MNGFSHPIDVIRVNDKYSVNICSVGFDARVGTDVHKYSKLHGLAAYIVSLIVNYFKGINSRFTIKIGDQTYSDEFALVCACNGRYYGGGFNPMTDNMPNDGVMETLIVKKCSRLKFIALIMKYAKGRINEMNGMVIRSDSDNITIEADEEIAINLDGELIMSKNVEFQMVHGGVNLLCPLGLKFFDRETKTLSKSK